MRNMFTGQLDEMDSDFRETGNPSGLKEVIVGGVGQKVSEYTKTPYRNVPICFALAYPLAEEVQSSAELQEKNPDFLATRVLEVITKDRPCFGYTDWKQGFTPKEHRELLDRRWMMERADQLNRETREREERLRERLTKEVREREDKRDKDAEDRHVEQMKTLRGHHWRELVVFGGLIGLATVIAGILDGVIGRGWTPWPF